MVEKVQEHLSKANWNAAVTEMEKLYAIRQDPLIRVRIGNIMRKLDRKDEAIREYLYAAALFAERGFVMKALAQYGLALRLDPSNADITPKIEKLRMSYTVVKQLREPVEYRPPEPLGQAL
jgi:tetratricopeptide (TPR) repeat protein